MRISTELKDAEDVIARGGVAVIPTDTIYGIVGSALREEVVERIYETRERSKDKPFIVLLSQPSDLQLFGISPDATLQKFLSAYWPGAVSVILSGLDEKFAYLHRGKGTIAFRVPARRELQQLLAKTGPLVAPSANPEGFAPATNIEEAKEYFRDQVDLYVDAGKISSRPSTLVSYSNGRFEILREGKVGIALE